MPRSRLVALLLGCVALGAALAEPAQGPGRFAFRKTPPVAGFRLDSNGFRANNPAADTLRFVQPAKHWKAAEVSTFGATYLLGGSGRAPGKLRVNLLAPGFELHFQGGFGFSVGSNLSPFVTWSEGSVGAGVPTPKANWFLVSFQDSQPPLLFVFPGEKAAIRVSGRTGAWRIDSIGVYQGWMRIALPRGTSPVLAADAASLGALAKTVRERAAYWTAPPPALVSREARFEDDALVVAWRFNRAGALLPMPLLRARRAGYRIEVLTKTVNLGIETEEGPLAYSAEARLVLRFPRSSLGPGKAIVLGVPSGLPSSVSPLDGPGLFRYAAASRYASASEQVTAQLTGLMADYLASAPEHLDSASGRRLPYDQAGVGLDLVATYAMIGVCLGVASNPMLEAWEGALDWSTWRPWPSSAASRPMAVLAVAGVLGGDTRAAVLGAMAETALVASGERGPLENDRRALYRRLPEGMPEERWVQALRSPWRSLAAGPVSATDAGAGYDLVGEAGAEIAAREGVPYGPDLTPLGSLQAGWARYAIPRGKARIPPTATPIPPAPRLPELR